MNSAIIDSVEKQNINFWASVPCSIMTPLYNAFDTHAVIKNVTATSEGEAIGIASGAWLAGINAGVMMQNSGLGNAVNPLTSLNQTFQIPLALMVTWRGQPGRKDEPQHKLMGSITPSLLSLLNIGSDVIDSSQKRLEAIFKELSNKLADRMSHALIIPNDLLITEKINEPSTKQICQANRFNFQSSGQRPIRFRAIETCLNLLPDNAVVIASTGKTGRELFTISDQSNFFYQVGSMGCASALGLGISLNTPLKVVVIDGDGAALMKLGNLATIGHQSPENLIHIILDNETYDSTGGQQTSAQTTDFALIAQACGYRNIYKANCIEGFKDAVQEALEVKGPTLVHMKIESGSLKNLARPSVQPVEVALRFRKYLKQHR
ncbi:phosphonopyruvate decarboxylase [uncultured Shewanella sp.]|uniref:phosphonopyruvate decarboxylase n=1 Tax=uncultured Shewanella sp. TaxID=173975 RepID=UPI00262300DC|nr:phosphonopyruvate decarboxylase [uncultured Shewanella sp.]